MENNNINYDSKSPKVFCIKVAKFMIYKKTPLTTIEIVRLLGWIIKNIFPIAVLTSSVTSVSTEMTRTSKIVSKLMSINETHPQVKYEMEQFLIELLHRNVDFTACGLFSIDGSLLTSIISTTITYLIIFLQFKRSNRGISKKNQTNIYSIEGMFNTTEFYTFNFTNLYNNTIIN
ncbi:gustatory and pheromone receptor 32a-like [Chelonus insularis]|uniref:gustatory and pheromone receptor 32a-like n=1 Tax=Chelonus insularis TaxID=460826 RepID=UPI00158DBFFF|nr:gustatory and pheromone receptor 32a-like [Chelonus insularis]